MECVQPVAASERGHRPVILAVEDDLLLRSTVSDYLRSSGFAVIEAANASEAMAVFASETKVDVVFIDIKLAGAMNGRMLELWLNQRYPHMPVLLTSGVVEFATGIEGAANFIQKPYRLADLKARLEACLGGGSGMPV
jgi:DNA-binding response OmpR family regulator